jgi:hypothetical protein
MYPILIIDNNLEFVANRLSEQGITIYDVSSVEDAREVMGSLYGLSGEAPIALQDLSRLGSHMSLLLKFVEESRRPLILLASQDNLPGVLLSRIATIKKVFGEENFMGGDLDEFLAVITSEEVSGKEVMSVILSSAPSLYEFYRKVTTSDIPAKKRLTEVYIRGIGK